MVSDGAYTWPRADQFLIESHEMNIDNAVKLIDAITKLLGVMLWPAVVLFVLIRFGAAFRDFIASMGEFSLKGVGFEASAKRKAEAAAALAAAAASHAEPGAPPDATARDARAAADVVAEFVTPRMIRRAGRSTVLWVDDRPDNNVHERQALEALGVSFVLAKSTEEAIEKLHRGSFDAIISDMGRPPDSRAGYTLLDRLRAEGDRTPFIIYAGSRDPEHRAEAIRHGAVGCTNRPDELFAMVLRALRMA
jgi:CheY-like chemotaxis protein